MATDEEILRAINGPPPSRNYRPDDAPSPDAKGMPSDEELLKAINSGAQGSQPKQSVMEQLGAAAKNTLTGGVKGLDEMFYGPIITALHPFAPEFAKALYDKVSAPTAVTQEDPSSPLSYEVGKVLGTSAGAAATGLGGLVGVGGAGAEAGALGRLGGGALVGATLNSTSMKDPDTAGNRVADMITGAIGGAGGEALGAGAAKFATQAINYIGASKFIKLAQEAVAPLADGNTALKSKILDTYQSVKAQKDKLFSIRDASGAEMGDRPAAQLNQKLADFETELKQSSVNSRVGPTLKKVQDEFSSDDDTGLVKVGGTTLDPSNPDHARLIASLKQQGVNFTPATYSPKQLFASLTQVNKEIGKTKDKAALTQLYGLKSILKDEVDQVSVQAGKSPGALMRQYTEANDYFKENVLPFRQVYGLPAGGGPATGGLTEKEVTDKAISVMESNDKEKIDQFMKTVGSGRPANYVGALMMQQGIMKSTDKAGKFTPGMLAGYFKQHKMAVDALPPDMQGLIKGYTNVMTATDKAFHVPGMHMTPSLLMFFGVEHALQGNPGHALTLMGSGVGAMAAFRSFGALLSNPKGRLFLQAARKLPPDSPRLLKLINQAAPLVGAVGGEEAVSDGNGGASSDQTNPLGSVRALPSSLDSLRGLVE